MEHDDKSIQILENVLFYNGTDVRELTKQELIEALKEAHSYIIHMQDLNSRALVMAKALYSAPIYKLNANPPSPSI